MRINNKGGYMLILILVGTLGPLAFRHGPVGRALLVGVLLSLIFCLRLSAGAEAAPAANALQATNSREGRENALRSIPFDQLDQDSRLKVDAVLANVSIYRRLPSA